MALNWLDFVLLALMAFFALRSFRRGFTREVIGLATGIVGIVLGMWFYGTVASLLAPYIKTEWIADMVGFLLIVFGVMILGGLLGRVISGFIHTIGLSTIDRLMGAGIGVLKGLGISITILTALMSFGGGMEADSSGTQNPFSLRGAVLHSRIAPYVLRASDLLITMAPMDLKTRFEKQYDDIKSAL